MTEFKVGKLYKGAAKVVMVTHNGKPDNFGYTIWAEEKDTCKKQTFDSNGLFNGDPVCVMNLRKLTSEELAKELLPANYYDDEVVEHQIDIGASVSLGLLNGDEIVTLAEGATLTLDVNTDNIDTISGIGVIDIGGNEDRILSAVSMVINNDEAFASSVRDIGKYNSIDNTSLKQPLEFIETGTAKRNSYVEVLPKVMTLLDSITKVERKAVIAFIDNFYNNRRI